MTVSIAAVAHATVAPSRAMAAPDRGPRFRDVLSALNPLQYLPVIGTIYRAATGDVIPDALRRVGSLVVSVLLGGPIGVAINLATMAAEKISGIDLDRTGQRLVHEALGEPAGRAATGSPTNAVDRKPALPQATPAPADAGPPRPWSAAQLAAYGVRTDQSGEPLLAQLRGADVLNSLELSRLRDANAAYRRVALPSCAKPGGAGLCAS